MSPQTAHKKSSLQKALQVPVRVSLVTGIGYQATGMVTKPKNKGYSFMLRLRQIDISFM